MFGGRILKVTIDMTKTIYSEITTKEDIFQTTIIVINGTSGQ